MSEENGEYKIWGFPVARFDGYTVGMLKWTQEWPTEPGYYWVHFKADFPQPIIAYFERDERGHFYADIDDEKYSLEAFAHWLGPLPIPEPPA